MVKLEESKVKDTNTYILYSDVVRISMEKEDPHFVCCDGFVHSNSN